MDGCIFGQPVLYFKYHSKEEERKMRNLTIMRAKSVVACAATMKVYIEDPESNDLTINGCSCRKLGNLKNGEVKTFEISEHAAKVFVIADKLSKGYASEYYPLEAGTEDVTLVGKNNFNPATGNAFRFDGVTDEEVLKHRKKGNKIGIIVLIAALLLGFAIGMLANRDSGEPKDFTVNGMQITLTDEFRKQSAAGFTAGYGSKEVAVLVLEEEFSLQAGFGDLTLREYADLVLKNSGYTTTIKTENGVTYFEYEATVDNGTVYHYVAAMYKGPDAFWLIQFATEKEDAAAYRDQIFTWAKSVTFE